VYTTLLYLHGYNRWLVLSAAAVALTAPWRAFLRARSYGRAEQLSAHAFARLLDGQVLLGLALYALSPIVRIALGDLGAAMAVKELRFFGVEHITGMVLAGRLRERRATPLSRLLASPPSDPRADPSARVRARRAARRRP